MNKQTLDSSAFMQPSLSPSTTLGLETQHSKEDEEISNVVKSKNGNKLNERTAKGIDILEDTQIIDPKLNDLPEHIKTLRIDLSIDEPDIEFLFERDGVGCISKGDIITIKGKAKAGKSTFLICLITALLTGEYMGFRARKQGCKAIYVDTEQNPANTRRIIRKVNALCGYDDKTNKWGSLEAFNLRGNESAKRSSLVDEIVKYSMPDLLIIDGAKDLISNGDINDPKTCGDVAQQFMTLTKIYPISIITILHENKNDTNLRGHIGSELLNKSNEVWQVKKLDGVFEVEQTDNRNESVDGFSFTINNEKLPVAIAFTPKIAPAERLKQNKLNAFRKCLPPLTMKRYSELVTLYCEYGGCKDSTALNHIKDALNWGYLIKDDSGLYKFNYLKT